MLFEEKGSQPFLEERGRFGVERFSFFSISFFAYYFVK